MPVAKIDCTSSFSCDKLNNMINELNSTASEVNNDAQIANNSKDIAVDAKNVAESARDEAVNAKENVEQNAIDIAKNAADIAVKDATEDANKAKDEAIIAKNIAENAANTATIKADEIKSYVIPTEATYSPEAIDQKILGAQYYSIGIPGKIGFGVGICPEDDLPEYLVPMPGTYTVGHDNYGNYYHPVADSVFVFIPKHYYKIIGNAFYCSTHKEDKDYVLERAFINSGEEMRGIFVSKYQGSNYNGIFASRKSVDPVSTHSDHNPVANINGCDENRYDELYTACKSLGDDFFLTSIFVYSMLSRLAKAHAAAGTVATCAFKDISPYLPKGCNNNALKDTNDNSVEYEESGYSNCGKTGSATNFAKTSHNGQNCGVVDINGNMWEVASGFTRDDNDFKILKESVDIASLTEDSAYDYSNYETIDISDLVSDNDGWIRLGNGANQVFEFSADRNSTSYKRTSLSIPAASGASSGGTVYYGNDGVYRYLRSSMACLVGGNWGYGSLAGAFALLLLYARGSSNYSVGGRASVFL